MLNYIWAVMIIIGVVYGAATGNINEVGNGAIESSKEAITLCITMTGVMSMWMGFMKVAEKSGLIESLEKKLRPIIRWMFPNMPENHKARKYIATNIIANVLGLGWAATPAGLKAMEEFANEPIVQGGWEEVNGKIVKSKKGSCLIPKYIATDEMCAFLVINISSLQLIPVNMIAYRSQYGSPNPAAIILPAIIATTVSTGIGIIYCKIMYKKNNCIK